MSRALSVVHLVRDCWSYVNLRVILLFRNASLRRNEIRGWNQMRRTLPSRSGKTKQSTPEYHVTHNVSRFACASFVPRPVLLVSLPSLSGETLPLRADEAQPPRPTPRMAEVATAHPLLQDSTRETSTEKRKERRRRKEHTT